MDKVGIGLLGYGTVGSGVGKLLAKNADDVTLATGKQVYLKRVLEKDPGFTAPASTRRSSRRASRTSSRIPTSTSSWSSSAGWARRSTFSSARCVRARTW